MFQSSAIVLYLSIYQWLSAYVDLFLLQGKSIQRQTADILGKDALNKTYRLTYIATIHS